MRLSILLLLAVTPFVHGETKTPSLTLVNSIVQLKPAAAGEVLTSELLVQAADFDAGELKKAQLSAQDLHLPAYPKITVQIGTPVPVSKTNTGGIWRLPLTITGFPPQNSIPRKVSLALGQTLTRADYTLTDKPAAQFSWSVLAPPVWYVAQSQVLPIPVIVKEQQATGIRLLHTTLARSGEPGALSI